MQDTVVLPRDQACHRRNARKHPLKICQWQSGAFKSMQSYILVDDDGYDGYCLSGNLAHFELLLLDSDYQTSCSRVRLVDDVMQMNVPSESVDIVMDKARLSHP